MDIEPKPTRKQDRLTPEALSDPKFYDTIKEFEQIINESPLEGEQLRALIDHLSAELQVMMGVDYYDVLVDVVGDARVADENGDLTGEETFLYADGLVYIGIDIVDVSSMIKNKVVFRFVDCIITGSGDDTTSIEVHYCMQIGDCVKLVPTPEDNIDNDYLLRTMAAHAYNSEVIVQDDEFLTASIDQQLETLDGIATDAGRMIMGICGDDDVAIYADTYYVVSPSEKGLVYTLVDQSDIPLQKQHMPVGKPDGCTFKECMTTDGITPIAQLENEYPSLIVTDDENDRMFLIPIRALKAVLLVGSPVV